MTTLLFRRLALALLLSCGAATAASAQTTLRIGLAEDPDVLDPSLARTYVGRIVFASICDKLFDIDENLKIVPQLALSNETSADGKTVTIKLRPGVKFHDGEPLDAAAAKYSLDRHLNMKGSFRKSELSTVDSVEMVDPLTIKLNLKTPFSPLLALLTAPAVRFVIFVPDAPPRVSISLADVSYETNVLVTWPLVSNEAPKAFNCDTLVASVSAVPAATFVI